MQKRETLSIICLTFSLLIFSVIIPISRNKVDRVKERRETYFRNLLSAQFHQAIGTISTNLWSALDVLKKSKGIENVELKASIEEIQKIYFEQAENSATNFYFLQTEPVTDDNKPDKSRYNKIKEDIKQKSKMLNIYSDSFLADFNQKYIKELTFWNLIEMSGYIFAIFLQIIGIWLGLITKNNSIESILKEIRSINSRLNMFQRRKK